METQARGPQGTSGDGLRECAEHQVSPVFGLTNVQNCVLHTEPATDETTAALPHVSVSSPLCSFVTRKGPARVETALYRFPHVLLLLPRRHRLFPRWSRDGITRSSVQKDVLALVGCVWLRAAPGGTAGLPWVRLRKLSVCC